MSDKTPLIIPADSGLQEAVLILKAGGIIAYPTETFYGLAADPGNQEAVKRLIKLKHRPEGKAIPLIIAELSCLKTLISGEVPYYGEKLIKSFWPGPLTLIFHASARVPQLITGKSRGIGIRISDYPLCNQLLKAAGFPLTSTSANPAGSPPAREALQVQEYFNGDIDLIIDGGKTSGSMASTVVDIRGESPVVLREGPIKRRDIQEAAE